MRRGVLACAVGLAAAGSLVVVVPAQAAAGPVVISELNYHAYTDLATDDFLELTNVGGRTNWRTGNGGIRPDGEIVGLLDPLVPFLPSAGLLWEF